MVFEIMSDAEMDKITPEFDHMEDHGATLAIDVKISPDNTHRYTCVGYEDGYCSLSIVEITEVRFHVLKPKLLKVSRVPVGKKIRLGFRQANVS